MRFHPHNYQKRAIRFLLDRSLRGLGSGLFLDPGLGKTSITLSWLRVLRELGIVRKTLVVAPLRVVYSVWSQECEKWESFRDFRVVRLHGPLKKREKALATDADLYLINPDGLAWLLSCKSSFDALVVDESTVFKTWGSKRTKAIRKIAKTIPQRVILTGTPTPNSIADIFSQIFIADLGDSLGTGITHFHNRYFYRGGYGGYEWKLIEGRDKQIEEKIAPVCLRLSAKEYLDLPDLIVNDIFVDLPDAVRKRYKKLERELFFELDSGDMLTPTHAGAKYAACRQIANGGIYTGDPEEKTRSVEDIHSAKIDALSDLVDELQGKPVLIAFQFKHDLGRLRKKFGEIPSIDGSTKATDAAELVDKWNLGELPLLAVQPQSLSHGVNMQAGPGRDIAWLGCPDSLETYQQLNARLHRQGVTGSVRVHRILASKTVDEAIADRLASKDGSQAALLEALNNYRGRNHAK